MLLSIEFSHLGRHFRVHSDLRSIQEFKQTWLTLKSGHLKEILPIAEAYVEAAKQCEYEPHQLIAALRDNNLEEAALHYTDQRARAADLIEELQKQLREKS